MTSDRSPEGRDIGAAWGRASIARIKAVDAVRHLLRRPRSIRLTFRFDDSGIRIIDRTPRLKPARVSEPLATPPHPAKIIAEVRSPQGAPVFRATLNDPIPQSVEIFEPDGRPQRVASVRSTGVFSVVVPVDRRADHIVIEAGENVRLAQEPFALLPEAESRRRVLGRFPLRKGRWG